MFLDIEDNQQTGNIDALSGIDRIQHASDETIAKFAESIEFINSKHDLFGTYSYDFKEIKDELQYIKEEYALEKGFYNSNDEKFSSIEAAYKNEQDFALLTLNDFFKDRAMRRMNHDDWLKVLRALKKSIPNTVAVELRLYPTSKGKYRVYFIHSIDWDETERRMMPILSKCKLKAPEPITKF